MLRNTGNQRGIEMMRLGATRNSKGLESKLVKMMCNGRWEPTLRPEGQCRNMTAEFVAYLVSFEAVSALGTVFSGHWATLEEAQRFARSIPNIPGKESFAQACKPYWYMPAFGRLPEEENSPTDS